MQLSTANFVIMSNETLPLDQAINILREAGLKINEIYEATGKDKMEHYNILRSNNEFRKKAYLNEIIKAFPDKLSVLAADGEPEANFQQKYIQALERENTLLQRLNDEKLQRILFELDDIKKRLET